MNYFGIDVSKLKLDCIWFESGTGQVETMIVDNQLIGFNKLKQWIASFSTAGEANLVCLEATGIYHEQAAEYLHNQGYQVYVVNPAYARNYAKALGVRNKTDKVDAWLLAKFVSAEHQSFVRYQPPALHVKQLRLYNSRLAALTANIQQETVRLKNLASGAPEPVERSISQVIDCLETQKYVLEQDLDAHIKRFPDLDRDYALLLTIPSVGPVLSRTLLELFSGRDFTSAAQVASFLGLVPVQKESGTSIRAKPRISKAGDPAIRSLLYMATISATRFNPDITEFYSRLVQSGKPKKAALVAASRKLLHIAYAVISTKTPYQVKKVSHERLTRSSKLKND